MPGPWWRSEVKLDRVLHTPQQPEPEDSLLWKKIALELAMYHARNAEVMIGATTSSRKKRMNDICLRCRQLITGDQPPQHVAEADVLTKIAKVINS